VQNRFPNQEIDKLETYLQKKQANDFKQNNKTPVTVSSWWGHGCQNISSLNTDNKSLKKSHQKSKARKRENHHYDIFEESLLKHTR